MSDWGAIEAAAAREALGVLEQVPAYVWDGERTPVPVEQIVDSVYGLLVRDVDEITDAEHAPELAPGQSLAGLLLADRGEIWVNAAEARQWPTRRRFTISHELGHWVMHREGQRTIFCRAPLVSAEVVTAEAPARPPLPDIEVAANAFAAELLMPPHLVTAAWDGDAGSMCERFNVSRAAMDRRLARLGLAARRE